VGKFLLGLIFGIVLFPAGVILYLTSGNAPAATSAPPMPFERYIAGTALRNRINHEAPRKDASSFSTQDLVAGADIYKKNCAVCHGSYEQAAPPMANRMYPEAPQLLTSEGMVTDDPVGVTYWKVSNGIRLTGMPSFGDVLSDQQKWQVSAMLARINKLPLEAQAELRAPVEPKTVPSPVPPPAK
jgi:thiosulfate dehydrogenase